MNVDMLPAAFLLWLASSEGIFVPPDSVQVISSSFDIKALRPITDDEWYERRQPQDISCDTGKPHCERAYLVGRGKFFYGYITCTDYCVAMTFGKSPDGTPEFHRYEWIGTMSFGPGEFDTFIFELSKEGGVIEWMMQSEQMYWTILNFHPFEMLCCPFTGLRR